MSTGCRTARSSNAFLILDEKFDAGRLSPVDIVIEGENSDPVNAAIDDLKAAIEADPGFASVGPTIWSDANDLALVQANLEADANSDAAYDQVALLRESLIPAAFEGVDARSMSPGIRLETRTFFDLVDQRTPLVFAFVLGLSFILLTIAFRSVVVPATAIVMNLLSVGAAYGALVLVFQKGYLTRFLRVHARASDRSVVAALSLLCAIWAVDGLPGLPAFPDP